MQVFGNHQRDLVPFQNWQVCVYSILGVFTEAVFIELTPDKDFYFSMIIYLQLRGSWDMQLEKLPILERAEANSRSLALRMVQDLDPGLGMIIMVQDTGAENTGFCVLCI